MKAKLALLVGAAAGYVLGTRAGRERYDQIKSTASELWQNNRVQDTVSGAEDFVASKAPDVQHKVGEAARSAVDAARSKLNRRAGDGHGDEPTLAETTTATADTDRNQP
ncbi:MAG TPA: YtxH domain-containing protein [Jiangellaceae bacterium]